MEQDERSSKTAWRKPATIAGAVIAVIAIIMVISYQREMSERRRAAEEGTTALAAYRAKLQEVGRVLSTSGPAGEDTVCSDAVIEKAAQGRARVRLELLSETNLGAITSGKPLTNERATAWMTGGWIRLIHWEAAPGSPELGDATRLLGNIRRDSGALVGVVRVTTLMPPKLARDEPDASSTEAIIPGTFTPGFLSAWLFVVDTDSATTVCQARIESTNSDSVEYKRRLVLMNDAESKVQDDFVAQGRAEAVRVAKRMHPKLNIGL